MTNLNAAEFEDRGVNGFRVRRARVAQEAGAKKLGVSLWEVPAGEAAYPYHWHVIDEEVVVVLDGGLSLRGPSGKIGVYAEELYELYPRGSAVGYWEGERPPTQAATRPRSR